MEYGPEDLWLLEFFGEVKTGYWCRKAPELVGDDARPSSRQLAQWERFGFFDRLRPGLMALIKEYENRRYGADAVAWLDTKLEEALQYESRNHVHPEQCWEELEFARKLMCETMSVGQQIAAYHLYCIRDRQWSLATASPAGSIFWAHGGSQRG